MKTSMKKRRHSGTVTGTLLFLFSDIFMQLSHCLYWPECCAAATGSEGSQV